MQRARGTTLLCLALTAHVACVPRGDDLLAAGDAAPRIVNGEEAAPFSLPYQLSMTDAGSPACGATLVHESWAVTAAHCFGETFSEATSRSPSDFAFSFYRHRIETGGANEHPCSQEIQAASFTIHPEYTGNLNDIALVELAVPAACAQAGNSDFDPRAVALIDGMDGGPSVLQQGGAGLYTGETFLVSGWGTTREHYNLPYRCYDNSDEALYYYYTYDVSADDDSISRCEPNPNYPPAGNLSQPLSPDALQFIEVPRVTDAECAKRTSGYRYCLLLCAGRLEGGQDSCQGDSGGPLVKPPRNEIDPSILVGVVAFGYGCARAQHPGYYTRVAGYAQWLASVAPAIKSAGKELGMEPGAVREGCTEPGRCAGWCATSPKPWQNKCGFDACAGCGECTQPPPNHCQDWCAGDGRPWEDKCRVDECKACDDCSSNPPPFDACGHCTSVSLLDSVGIYSGCQPTGPQVTCVADEFDCHAHFGQYQSSCITSGPQFRIPTEKSYCTSDWSSFALDQDACNESPHGYVGSGCISNNGPGWSFCYPRGARCAGDAVCHREAEGCGNRAWEYCYPVQPSPGAPAPPP